MSHYLKSLVLGFFTMSAFAFTEIGETGEIGFVEDFSLAPDRTVPLKQLIPGTEDYYFYNALHLQNTEQFDKVEQLLADWIKRSGETQRAREIMNRQALLMYEKNPQKSLEYIRSRIGIQFNHQREVIGAKPNLPTALDPKSISRETLQQRAMSRHGNLDGFEDAALDWLAAAELQPDRRRNLLQRLTRPDYPNLVTLVLADLAHQNSGGFGSLPIHGQMLMAQLDDLVKQKPDLRNQSNFVNAYLAKLVPTADQDWQNDPAVYVAYLDRLEKFAVTLSQGHNSLKANILFHRLVHERAHGNYDRERFLSYIKLPRGLGYMNQKYVQAEAQRGGHVDLNANYQHVTLLPPVGNDEPLIRDFVLHFFVDAQAITPFDTYLNDIYLKHAFAEAKIVNGLGDGEQWASQLPPDAFRQLKDRIDLDFAATNKNRFPADEPVRIDLFTKNVSTLIVKVFEINTRNFYRENMREVDTDINLDGLVANDEQTYKYSEAPLRRVRRSFEFKSLAKPGTYVIDFIGNGKSSRVLVQKGKLRHLVRTSAAGHIFTVYDEQNRQVNNVSLWLAGHEYEADKNGEIAVPFSTAPRSQPIILSHGEFCSLDNFQHEAETYSLVAGIYVDREALLTRKKAKIVVRPALYINGLPTSLSVLENVKLAITSVDHDGVSSSTEVADFKLYEDRESVHEILVPQRLTRISFSLVAKVKNLSLNQKQDLAVHETFALNEIEKTDKIEDLHFVGAAAGYAVDLLGKTGEPKADRAVQLVLKHREFREPVHVTLKTDVAGRVTLGELKHIVSVQATGPEGVSHTWWLPRDARRYQQSLHGVVGQPLEVPYLGGGDKPDRAELSLIEIRGGHFFADRFDALSLANGMVRIGALPAGDYDLLLKRTGTRIAIRLTAGAVTADNFVLGANRQLELRGAKPLHIEKITTAEKTIDVQLRNTNKFTRVHVFATRYQPAYSAFGSLARPYNPEPYTLQWAKVQSTYLAGRNIGDEYRYILDRKYATKLPGNMLERPSLLLNPWAVRTTETAQQMAQAGDDFYRAADPQSALGGRGEGKSGGAGGTSDFANLDFLGEPSLVTLNLMPDENGVVSIERDSLGPHQQLHVIAVDPLSTVYRSVNLPEQKPLVIDLRLANGLDPKLHFTQQKQITVLEKGKAFVIADIASSRFELYDSLPRVFRLYSTLSNAPQLNEFGFILNWGKLKPEEQREQYSKFASHELTFFLMKKDPEFFKSVIGPYLKNKKDKTYLDHWLVADPLTDFRLPWNHARLNVVERILLGQRLPDEQAATSRHVRELWELIPPNVERDNHLFHTSLQGQALEATDALGLQEQLKSVRREVALEKLNEKQAFKGAPAPVSAPAAPPGLAAAAPAKESAERDRAAAAKPADAQARKKAAESGDALRYRNAMKDEKAKADKFFDADGELANKRQMARQFYRKLDSTQEWAENNYYKLLIEQQNENLVTANAFWRDYAAHDPNKPFLSRNFAEASRNFTEIMFALAVLDLPAEAAKHETKFDGPKMTLIPGSAAIICHEEIKQATLKPGQTPLLVSQNFFRASDRYRMVDNERQDKFVTDEFLIHVVYGGQVVVTNPTSSRQKLEVLIQIPNGSLPVANGQATKTVSLDLQPFSTQTVEYHFYFPGSGTFSHYPVHLSKNGELVGFAAPFTFNVVPEPTKVDKESWDYISQHGSIDDLVAFLNANNVHRLNLDRIAFRMQDAQVFGRLTGLLAARHAYNHTLWSYAIKHNAPDAAAEYLKHSDSFLSQCGPYLKSRLVTIDPVIRKSYQHLEYKPLVNARAHALGKRRQILNDRFFGQYHQLMNVLAYRPKLDDDDRMAITYYLLLQDRVEEGLATFKTVSPDRLETRMQYEYFVAYFDMFNDDPKEARLIAAKYAKHPVDRWRNTFAAIKSQLDELDGAKTKVVDAEDRNQQQTNLAATEASFDFQVEAKQIVVNYQNLTDLQVNFYLMDIELLFSRNPFVQQQTGQFSFIRPNLSQAVKLPKQPTHKFPLPAALHSSNVLVEIIGDGVTKTQAYYSHSLAVQVIENYGQVKVTHDASGKPIAKTYVKVFARMKDGAVRFYKDGYTDLRGRFDYTSLNTNELDFVDKFSLLILSETHGAVVREASPPKR